jgi:hypothetical protein
MALRSLLPQSRPAGTRMGGRLWRSLAILTVTWGSAIALSGCTGSPATLAMKPDFDMVTPGGVVSVSVREALPGMPDNEFRDVVMTGMEHGCSCAAVASRPTGPYPERRIVWHVTSNTASLGVSTVAANIFNGSVPFASAQAVVPDGIESGALIDTVASITRQLQQPSGRPKPP